VASALDELNARIAELRSDLSFVALALQLRPRIGAAVQWQAAGEVLDLVKHFMNAKSSRPEGFYGPLLVRLLAAFERYLRLLVSQSVERRAFGVSKFEDLSEKLSQRNVSLTGRLLAAIDAPRDHLTLDIEGLISNLATCKRGSAPFRLNAQAFAAAVTGASPVVIEKVLDYVDVSNCWDGVGGNTSLARLLQTKGARATGESARDRLRELWRWRNHLAHGGDEEIALTELQLLEAINFVHSFSAALDTVVEKRLNGT
jgi:RiboL-PSP-HEPN